MENISNLYTPVSAQAPVVAYHLEGFMYFCGKKDCCKKYKKSEKKRCKNCPKR